MAPISKLCPWNAAAAMMFIILGSYVNQCQQSAIVDDDVWIQLLPNDMLKSEDSISQIDSILFNGLPQDSDTRPLAKHEAQSTPVSRVQRKTRSQEMATDGDGQSMNNMLGMLKKMEERFRLKDRIHFRKRSTSSLKGMQQQGNCNQRAMEHQLREAFHKRDNQNQIRSFMKMMECFRMGDRIHFRKRATRSLKGLQPQENDDQWALMSPAKFMMQAFRKRDSQNRSSKNIRQL